jgi:mRNA interferase MazF
MRHGEVWVANLNPPRGNEIGKIRPVLIVQADELLDGSLPMVIVLPLTTQILPVANRWRVTIPARDRLLRDSQVVIDQPRALDRARLGEGPLTRLDADQMSAVEGSLRAVLGMV